MRVDSTLDPRVQLMLIRLYSIPSLSSLWTYQQVALCTIMALGRATVA